MSVYEISNICVTIIFKTNSTYKINIMAMILKYFVQLQRRKCLSQFIQSMESVLLAFGYVVI